jgi:hypothetical protein
MKLSAATSLQLFPIFQRWKSGARRPFADATAQYFAAELATEFSESVVLARVFFVLPLSRTPPRHRAFAAGVAGRIGEQLTDATRLLCLAGSSGVTPEWNQPTTSKGHLAIPLSSPRFVASLPMLSALFEQLGLWAHLFSEKLESSLRRRSLFFVPDARTARDASGRFVIPGRDFVAEHQVRSVFGGAETFNEEIAVCFLVFANEVLSDAQVESFSAVSHLILAAMLKPLHQKAYFG